MSLQIDYVLDGVVRGYRGKTTTATVVAQPGGNYDIGFVRIGDLPFTIVADWWGVERESPWKRAAFTQAVLQRYAYHKVLLEVERQGFRLVSESTQTDQSIKLVVRRWQ